MAVSERMNRAMRQHTSPAFTCVAPQMLLDAGFLERDGCLFTAANAHSVPVGELLDWTGREARPGLGGD